MININNKKFKIVAMGLRNAQGLHYDKSNQIIIFTEHGPKGGDEINLLIPRSIKDGKVENYGWAISSYGEHYGKRGQSTEKDGPLKVIIPMINILYINHMSNMVLLSL